MSRPAIPREIKRAVLIEAGHRCAIQTCKYPAVDVHHIIPWEKTKDHNYDNLIALCPNCHRRADRGEIDRKSLRMYKAQLSASIGEHAVVTNQEYYIINESQEGHPGYEFEFKVPRFVDPDLRVVEDYFRTLGNRLLHEHRNYHYLLEPLDIEFTMGPNLTTGSFEIMWLTSLLVSIKYRIYEYGSGAMHGNGKSITRTYLRDPVQHLDLKHLFNSEDYLLILSKLTREALLQDGGRDEFWVRGGTEPLEKNFASFNLVSGGLLLTFDEYVVDCYAAGPQVIEISWGKLKDIMNPRLLFLSSQSLG